MTSIGPDIPLRNRKTLAKIRTDTLPKGTLRDKLDGVLTKFGKHELLRRVLSNLHYKVTEVVFEIDPKQGSWASMTVGKKVIIKISPKYKDGLRNPGRLLMHELVHQTIAVKKWEKRQAAAWRNSHEHVREWIALVEKLRSFDLAEFVIKYGFSEPVCVYWENLFAKAIGEEQDLDVTFEEAKEGMLKTILAAKAKGHKVILAH